MMWKKLKPWEAPTFLPKDLNGLKGTLRFAEDITGEMEVEQLWFCEESTGKWFLLSEKVTGKTAQGASALPGETPRGQPGKET